VEPAEEFVEEAAGSGGVAVTVFAPTAIVPYRRYCASGFDPPSHSPGQNQARACSRPREGQAAAANTGGEVTDAEYACGGGLDHALGCEKRLDGT
jgi:hypothetical protein